MPDANPVDVFVGARLRERRLQRGFPLNRLSSQTGVSAARLLRFENGLERITPAIMIKFCGVLEIHPGYFFERTSIEACNERAPCETSGFERVSPMPVMNGERRR